MRTSRKTSGDWLDLLAALQERRDLLCDGSPQGWREIVSHISSDLDAFLRKRGVQSYSHRIHARRDGTRLLPSQDQPALAALSHAERAREAGKIPRSSAGATHSTTEGSRSASWTISTSSPGCGIFIGSNEKEISHGRASWQTR